MNPSSGNLHPTEAYIVCGPLTGLSDPPAVYHYAPDRHALEQRCVFDDDEWPAVGGRPTCVLVALTSIHWREAWKYGERAFRYCQHDLGHAIAAVRSPAASPDGARRCCPTWPQRAIAAATGVDRDEDFVDAEREEPGCIMALTAGSAAECGAAHRERLADAVSRGQWSGRASQLSEDHVEWSFIDEIARATQDAGRPRVAIRGRIRSDRVHAVAIDARALVLQRRSAVAFDGRSSIDRDSVRRACCRA